MPGQSKEQLAMNDVQYKSNKCSGTTRVVAVVAVLMTIATIVLAVLYGLEAGSSTKAPDPTSDVCQDPACVKAASRILSAMNTQADPCDDFFEYACGTWNSDHIIPDDKSSVSTFNGLRDDVSKVLKHVLERDSSGDRDSIKKAKDFYSSCMDTTQIDNLGVTPVKVLIQEMGSWPVIGDSFDSTAFVLEDTLAKFRSTFATYGIVSSWVSADDKNSSANILQSVFEAGLMSKHQVSIAVNPSYTRLPNTFVDWKSYGYRGSYTDMVNETQMLAVQLDQPSLGMPNRDYYLDEVTRNKAEPGYRKFMTDFMTMVAESAANATKIDLVVDEIIDFETELAKSMAPDSERRDSLALYNKMSLSELTTQTKDTIDWLVYTNGLLTVRTDTLMVTGDEQVVVYAPEYLKNVTAIIGNRWELVQNYLVWRVLKDRTSFMSSDLRATRNPYTQLNNFNNISLVFKKVADISKLSPNFYLATSGVTSEEQRWMTCSDTANSYFSMPVGSLFVQEVFPEENKAATLEMVEDIRLVFKQLLPGNDWMDQTTKDAASQKADDITPIIAYPDYIVDESNPKMDEDYQKASIDTLQYFQNIQHLNELSTTETFDQLRKAVDFTEWITGPAIVNAFYSPTRNQIVFPAGILQPPFYDAGQPTSMNYGGIGMVIGHELTHGFDDSGAQYDGQGNLNNWWSDSSKSNFETKSKCMEDQYSALSWETAGGAHVDGKLTLGENIADNGGIREAYGAYKKWQEANPDGDKRLPGLDNFTQDQLFFLGYAQVWCGTYTPEYAVRLLKTDPHSPGIFRVLVPSSNFPEFGEAYKCSKGFDGMYPNEEDTCRVW